MSARAFRYSPSAQLSSASDTEGTENDIESTHTLGSFCKCFVLGAISASIFLLFLAALPSAYAPSYTISSGLQDTTNVGNMGVSLDATAKRKGGGRHGDGGQQGDTPQGIRLSFCRLIGCNGGYRPHLPCQCTSTCGQYNNCCSDYASECGGELSPVKKQNCEQLGCHGDYQPGLPCQCNTACETYSNCCDDYTETCKVPAPQEPDGPVSNPDYHPLVPSLRSGSTAPVNTFYVYRAQAPAEARTYPLENVNTASLGGVIWYLHNEIIYSCDWKDRKGHRKFDITRILRFKVSVRATQPLANQGLNFGVKCSFDSGACTGPAHQHDYDQFGYYIGCDYLGEYPHEEFTTGKNYPEAIWYSFPGPCPFMKFYDATDQCNREQPGGHCKAGEEPTGAGDCTYTYEDAGEIDIDEMVGITPRWRDREDFCRKCGSEGNANQGGSCGLHFWDDIWNARKNQERVKRAADMFKQKYPGTPGDDEHPTPKCDFARHKYYR